MLYECTSKEIDIVDLIKIKISLVQHPVIVIFIIRETTSYINRLLDLDWILFSHLLFLV